MHPLVTIVVALLSPLVGLALLLWLAHLEDTLARDVDRARRRPDPAPILAIPVRHPQSQAQSRSQPQPQAAQVLIPAQRSVPESELSGPGSTVPA